MLAHACRSPVREAAEPAARPHRLAERRQVDHADRDAVLVLEREQVGVQRHAAGERLGAVDRVEDPAPPGGALRRRLLLAEHAVAGERLGQPLAEEPLGVAVGRRHRRAVTLALDLQVGGAEPPQRPLAGRPQQRDRGVERLPIDRRPVQSALLRVGRAPTPAACVGSPC